MTGLSVLHGPCMRERSELYYYAVIIPRRLHLNLKINVSNMCVIFIHRKTGTGNLKTFC